MGLRFEFGLTFPLNLGSLSAVSTVSSRRATTLNVSALAHLVREENKMTCPSSNIFDSVYLAAVLEYLAAEILELAGERI